MDTIFEAEELIVCTPLVGTSSKSGTFIPCHRQAIKQSIRDSARQSVPERQSTRREQVEPSSIETDWELDEILALKRYTPSTKELLVLELYNSMLEVIVESWDGMPCYHKKLRQELPPEEILTSQVSEDLEQQNSESAESLKENRSSTSKGARSKTKTLKKSSSDLKSPAKKKSSKTRRKTSSEAGSIIVDLTISETSSLAPGESSLDLSKTGLQESTPPEEVIKFEPPDENVTVVFTNGNVYTGRMSLRSMEGKGTFTWADGSKYEGDFIDNEMTGKGYIEWKDLSWYEGEVYQGLRHGNGLFVGSGDRKAYFGSWKMGHRDGKGYICYDSKGKDYYDGDWVQNKQDGSGIRSYNSGAHYAGGWKNGFQDGAGIMVWPNNQCFAVEHVVQAEMDNLDCVIEGFLKKPFSRINFNEKLVNKVYRGFWKEGKRCGYGEYIWRAFLNMELAFPMQNIFMGCWENNEKHGLGLLHSACGTIHLPSGLRFEGNWVHDKKHGSGILICRNGLLLNATFQDDVLVRKCLRHELEEPVTAQTQTEMCTESAATKESFARSSKSTSSLDLHDSVTTTRSTHKAFKPRLKRFSVAHGLQSSIKLKHQPVLETRKATASLESSRQSKHNSVKTSSSVETKDKKTKSEAKSTINTSKSKYTHSVATAKQEKEATVEAEAADDQNELEQPGVVLFASEIEIDLSYHLQRFNIVLYTSELPDETAEFSDSDEDSDIQPETDQDISSTYTFDSYFQDSTRKSSSIESSVNVVCDKSSESESKSTENTLIPEIMEFEKKWLQKSLKQLELDLRKLYHNYATIACRKEPEFPVVLTRLMLWQMARDCKFSEMTGCSLIELDRKLENNWTARINRVYDPVEPLLFWQFLHYLLEISWLLYSSADSLEYAKNRKRLPNPPGILGAAFQKFIREDVLPSMERHVGLALFSFRDVLPIQAVYKLYQKMGVPLSASQFVRQIICGSPVHNSDDIISEQQINPEEDANNTAPNTENVLPNVNRIPAGTNTATLGWEIFYIPFPKSLFWSNEDVEEPQFADDLHAKSISTLQQLGPKKLYKCLADVCPLIMHDGDIVNIEYELTFLEFYEVLLQCALCSIEIDKKIAEAETATEKSEETLKSVSKKLKTDKKKKKPPKSK